MPTIGQYEKLYGLYAGSDKAIKAAREPVAYKSIEAKLAKAAKELGFETVLSEYLDYIAHDHKSKKQFRGEFRGEFPLNVGAFICPWPADRVYSCLTVSTYGLKILCL